MPLRRLFRYKLMIFPHLLRNRFKNWSDTLLALGLGLASWYVSTRHSDAWRSRVLSLRNFSLRTRCSVVCLLFWFTCIVVLVGYFAVCCEKKISPAGNRPFALRGHVTSFFMKMKVTWFCLRKTISGSYLKQNNSDLVFQTRTIFLKWVSS